MELYIRSTAKTNLCKINALTIMEGSCFYNKTDWEYDGFTIADCQYDNTYILLGTYETKERAIEVLDEIHQRLIDMQTLEIDHDFFKICEREIDCVYQMPEE